MNIILETVVIEHLDIFEEKSHHVFDWLFQIVVFVLCLVALCSSAVINSAPDAIATPELEQNDQIDELESDDLSTAETANPQYFGTSN